MNPHREEANSDCARLLTGTLLVLVAVAWHLLRPDEHRGLDPVRGHQRRQHGAAIPHRGSGDRPARLELQGRGDRRLSQHAAPRDGAASHHREPRQPLRLQGRQQQLHRSGQPTRTELLGKLWIHMPHGGIRPQGAAHALVAAVHLRPGRICSRVRLRRAARATQPPAQERIRIWSPRNTTREWPSTSRRNPSHQLRCAPCRVGVLPSRLSPCSPCSLSRALPTSRPHESPLHASE